MKSMHRFNYPLSVAVEKSYFWQLPSPEMSRDEGVGGEEGEEGVQMKVVLTFLHFRGLVPSVAAASCMADLINGTTHSQPINMSREGRESA